jgi:hypothetical protein
MHDRHSIGVDQAAGDLDVDRYHGIGKAFYNIRSLDWEDIGGCDIFRMFASWMGSGAL